MSQKRSIPRRPSVPKNPWRARRHHKREREVAQMSPEEARQLLEKAFDLEGAKAACRAIPREVEFAYIPWIASHGDALFELINGDKALCAPIPLVPDLHEPRRRHRASASVRRRADVFLPMCREVFRELPPHVRGVLFSLDWNPVMRQAAYACKQLGLETILIPHEGIFARVDAYYQDLNNRADYPVCDRILAWGELQAEIFTGRGYPEDRVSVVGAPKFDLALNYRPQSSRDEFCARFGFAPERPIALFALQPLDSQYDRQRAKATQRKAVRALAAACRRSGAQLLLRGTPNGDDVLGVQKWLFRWLPRVALDEGQPYQVSAAEAIHHSSLVLAVNSTMLFEAAVMGRPSIAVPGAEAGAAWQLVGGPVISLDGGLDARVAELIERRAPTLATDEGSSFARALSIGRFDGQAVHRVRQALADPTRRREVLDFSDFSFLFAERVADPGWVAPGTLGFHRKPFRSMRHVKAMLGFNKFVVPKTLHDAARVDVFARWSGGESELHRRIDDFARAIGRPRLIVEDGLLRSVGLGVEGTPGLSLIIDDKAPYFDATAPSRLEDYLNADWQLDDAQRERCERAIARITELRLAKYNNAQDVPLALPDDSVLVVDQRAGDSSIVKGLAGPASFEQMLEAAVAENPGKTVVVKLHPDAISGRRDSALAQLPRVNDERGVIVIRDNVNPHVLLDACSVVYTVSSGLGFEALMRGRRVRCFGMPFYAGWGLTQDELTCPRRVRPRSVHDVFHAAYIVHSRYFSPQLTRVCDLEDLLDYFAAERGRTREPSPAKGQLQ